MISITLILGLFQSAAKDVCLLKFEEEMDTLLWSWIIDKYTVYNVCKHKKIRTAYKCGNHAFKIVMSFCTPYIRPI